MVLMMGCGVFQSALPWLNNPEFVFRMAGVSIAALIANCTFRFYENVFPGFGFS